MPHSIYDDNFLQALFDEMQDTYERVSNITSLGFNLRWRRQLVKQLNLQPGMVIADLMGGSGETWRYILPEIGATGQLINVDFSQAMCDYAHVRHEQISHPGITILQENTLNSSILDNSVDAVICIYGVKTLDSKLYPDFVQEIHRILKPGGRFGIIEISVPTAVILRLPYMLYLSQIVPVVGALLLGNHANYRLLSKYMSQFQNCSNLAEHFTESEFDTISHRFFFGCCTAITGNKI